MTIRRMAAMLLALSIFIAGCGGSDGDSSSEDASVAEPTSAAESSDTTDDSGDSGDSGDNSDTTDSGADATDDGSDAVTTSTERSGTFRGAYYVGISRFDPHKATSSFDNALLFITYDRLVHLAPDASPVPGLAETWEFSEDGSALTFNLRDGVTFHDGTPFNADAVKANIERGQTIDGSAVSAELAVIESVDVIDDLTVQLNLNGPAASLPLILSDRPGAMISPAAFDNPDLDVNPVGAGMFTVTDYQEGSSVSYAAYPDYWQPEAVNVEAIEMEIQADSSTRLNAIRTGQIDWTFVDQNQVADAESAGLTLLPTPALSSQHLQLNRARDFFQSVEVRQALNHAIDRDSIVQALLFGQADAAFQIFPEGYFAYSADAVTYPYDPDRARELLAEAGYPDGFEFELLTSTIPARVEASEAIQAQLAQVGITMNISQAPGAQIADLFYAQEQYDAIWASWGGRPDPSQTLSYLYTADGFGNPGDQTTPEIEAAIAATLEVQSDEERTEAIHIAIDLISAEALDVVGFYEYTAFVHSDRVDGVVGWFAGKPEFRGVRVVE